MAVGTYTKEYSPQQNKASAGERWAGSGRVGRLTWIREIFTVEVNLNWGLITELENKDRKAAKGYSVLGI